MHMNIGDFINEVNAIDISTLSYQDRIEMSEKYTPIFQEIWDSSLNDYERKYPDSDPCGLEIGLDIDFQIMASMMGKAGFSSMWDIYKYFKVKVVCVMFQDRLTKVVYHKYCVKDESGDGIVKVFGDNSVLDVDENSENFDRYKWEVLRVEDYS